MKKIILAIALALSMAATAGNKKQLTTTCFVTDIHCEMCVQKIMNNIPVLGRGIDDVKVDLPTKIVCVTFDTQKNDEQRIISGFATLRVNAQAVDDAMTNEKIPNNK